MAFARHTCGDGCNHPSTEDYASSYSLFKYIDIGNVICLNESISLACRKIFKPWESRLDREEYVESDVDRELLISIPFTGHVKLKGLIVMGDDDGTHPSKVRMYKNRPSMLFEDTAATADQELELAYDPDGMIEHNVIAARFNSTSHLTLHFADNMGAEKTRIYYIGLKGDFSTPPKQQPIIVNYEAAANPMDHKRDIFIGSTPIIK